jgi:hypothetical protein
MEINRYLGVTVLLAALAGCMAEPEELVPETGPYTLTISATKENGMTKALSDPYDGTLWSQWTAEDVVSVYSGENKLGELKAQSSGESTTLYGELSYPPQADDELLLSCRTGDYGQQDGLLSTIAATCDYCTATVRVSGVTGNKIWVDAPAIFKSQQAIVKFTLTNNSNPLAVKPFYVGLGTRTLTITPAAATNVLYVAIPEHLKTTGEDVKTGKYISLTAKGSDNKNYTLTCDDALLEKGKFYQVNASMNKAKIQSVTITNLDADASLVPTYVLGGKKVEDAR